MKSLVIAFCLSICMHLPAFCKIINGYEPRIREARISLNSYQKLLSGETFDTLTFRQKSRLKTNIERVTNYILHYQLTEILLERFKIIAPDIYQEIDNITDVKGRSTDVYVKFIPEEKMQLSLTGTADMRQAEDDPDACASTYGRHTVSINVAVCRKSLLQLAHEFGHIQHQVPNLATYVAYYQKAYGERGSGIQCIGHRTNDLSGKNANSYEKRFAKQTRAYYKTNNVIPPQALFYEIKRSMEEQESS